MIRCATFLNLELRPELDRAHQEMAASGQLHAYAICRTWDDQGWGVCTKQRNIYSSIEGVFQTPDEAEAKGKAWLAQQQCD